MITFVGLVTTARFNPFDEDSKNDRGNALLFSEAAVNKIGGDNTYWELVELSIFNNS